MSWDNVMTSLFPESRYVPPKLKTGRLARKEREQSFDH